jgi:glucosamine-6-phosphate deaminase
LNIRVFDNAGALAASAAEQAAVAIAAAIQAQGEARVVAATGASQLVFLQELTKHSEINWAKVRLFQLDEYLGLPSTHAASFTKYIRERLVAKTGIVHYHALDGSGTSENVLREASRAICTAPIDVAFAGIGENGHLAFNDPPADFTSEEPYILVGLDDACRRQQVGEGWFADLAQVPTRAISMSIQQILRAKQIVAVVPELRKARAVQTCCEGPISPMAPASILRTHSNVTVYLDRDSASLLRPETVSRFAAGSAKEPYPTHTSSMAT